MWPARATIPTRDEAPKIYRYYLLGTGKTWGVFLHHFVAADAAGEMHDHPWRWGVAVVLAGGYREERLGRSGAVAARRLRAGSFNLIRGTDFHRVEPDQGGAWTLFLHSPVAKRWSFLDLVSRTLRQYQK